MVVTTINDQEFSKFQQICSPDAAIAESGGFDIPRIALRFIQATCLVPARSA